MSALGDYLTHVFDREWKWGELDCFLFCADWIKAATGADPAAEFRGAYGDERAARKLIKAQGGITVLAGVCMCGCGFSATLDPIAGDVGLVRVPILLWRGRTVSAPVGAICLRPRMWVVKTRMRGEMVAQDFPVVAAWALCPQNFYADA